MLTRVSQLEFGPLPVELEEALDYLQPAAERMSNDPIVQYHYGRALEELGRASEAAAQYQRVIELAGDDDPRGQISDAKTRIAALSE